MTPNCNQPGCCSPSTCTPGELRGEGLNRRQLLQVIGMASAALLAGKSFAGPFEAADFARLVPPDKKLSPEWLRSLTERGQPTVYRGKELDLIGFPIGGIGAGQVYLGGDGRPWHWDIFNHPAPTGDGHYAHPPKPAYPFEQGFSIRLAGGQPIPLDKRGFSDISFTGQYPIARVEYRDPKLPVEISLEAFSPFIPLNTDDSSLPATIFQFTLRNTSNAKLDCKIGGHLENAICRHTGTPDSVIHRNACKNSEKFSILTCSAISPPVPAAGNVREDILFEDFEKPTYEGWTATGTAFGPGPLEVKHIPGYQGDVGGKGQRVVNSHNTRNGEDVGKGDAHVGTLTSKPFKIDRHYIHFLIGGGAHKGKTCLDLLIDDKIVLSATGKNDNHMLPASFDVRQYAGKTATLRIVDNETGGWGNIGLDNIVFSDKPSVSPIKLQDQHDFGLMALLAVSGNSSATADRDADAKAEQSRPFGQQLIGAVSAKCALEPNQSTTVTFILAWHFPNLRLDRLQTDGHWYARQFASAIDVALHIVANLDRLVSQTKLWRDTWYDSTLPHWFLDRTFANTSILATATCYRFGNGRFYAWEGVGCCPGTCGHVWHYAQAMGRLFPDLERACREKVDYADGVGFDPKTGAIDFRAEFRNGWAADGQTGTILRVYREHQMSADDGFLRRLWPKVKQSIEFLIKQDGNDDGILDGPQPNTLDTTWYGPMGWLTSLYLASLRAGEEMARETGDVTFADRCRAIFERGTKKIVELCWNGEYFVHHPDPKFPDAMKSGNGCEIDQVFGQSWAFQLGLGRILDPQHTKQALQSLWKYNFTPDVGPFRKSNPGGRWYAMAGEGGLLMCTWPKGDKADAQGKAPDWAFGYFNECMSGFEHQVAGHMIAEGMVTEGLAIERAIHDRYHASRRNPWNEVECGDHYARAMASYGVFITACGFEYHGPKKHLAFAPKLTPENFKAPFTTAEGWGTFAQTLTGNTLVATLDLKFGRLPLAKFSLTLPAAVKNANVAATLQDAPVKTTAALANGLLEITLPAGFTLVTGAAIRFTIG